VCSEVVRLLLWLSVGVCCLLVVASRLTADRSSTDLLHDGLCVVIVCTARVAIATVALIDLNASDVSDPPTIRSPPESPKKERNGRNDEYCYSCADEGCESYVDWARA
jgi:hypothetical protein